MTPQCAHRRIAQAPSKIRSHPHRHAHSLQVVRAQHRDRLQYARRRKARRIQQRIRHRQNLAGKCRIRRDQLAQLRQPHPLIVRQLKHPDRHLRKWRDPQMRPGHADLIFLARNLHPLSFLSSLQKPRRKAPASGQPLPTPPSPPLTPTSADRRFLYREEIEPWPGRAL